MTDRNAKADSSGDLHEIKVLQAEIERLRDAIERIEQLDERMAPITNMVRAKEIAREALREVSDG